MWVYSKEQAGWFLQPDCTLNSERPSSECPRASIAARRLATPPVQSEYLAEHRAAAAVPLPESPWGKLQNLSPPSVLFESSEVFLQYTRDTDAKNDGPEF